ncbi:catalase [Rhodococcus hoagii]|nr:catalase [Prescottella equi]
MLLQDHHFREKNPIFDHERIPERVVHARGLQRTASSERTERRRTLLPQRSCERTSRPGFPCGSHRAGFSGVGGPVRDTRGFATKFYNRRHGTFRPSSQPLPVFFIHDAIKFPDIIHAGKPHPDREIPQAQSAHAPFWDFVPSTRRPLPTRCGTCRIVEFHVRTG